MRRMRDADFPDNGFEAWGGYMQAKIAKLEEQFSNRASTDENILSNIFNGISIYVNGYTKPSADELKILMSRHSGIYHTYQRSGDFIIASNLPDTKVKNMCLSRIVKPDWITDSIAANRLLDYKDYLLYNGSKSQPKLNFNSHKTKLSVVDCSNDIHSKTVNLSNNKSEINKTSLDGSANIPFKKEIVEHTISPKQSGNITNISENLPVTKSEPVRTAADPNFIADFYNNSRLHHISQLGACFKQYINELREKSDYLFPHREHLLNRVTKTTDLSQLKFDGDKVIMHIDMDCFFVSVGLRNRPELRGKPIAVTHSKGNQPRGQTREGVDRKAEFNLYKQRRAKTVKGIEISDINDEKLESKVLGVSEENDKYGSMSEIASCSYEARQKGIKNGMFMGAALRLCPDIVTIPYDFEGYKEVAYTLYNTIAQYTLDIEAVSCDEMYVDCTELIKVLNVGVDAFAIALRDEIKGLTGCPCSTGFGGNRLQARLATKKAKPDGQFFLTADSVHDFMYDINLRDLPGVGRQIAHRLEMLGHTTCGTLLELNLTTLHRHLGIKTGAQLFDQCRGIDANPLVFNVVRKSVSAEVNYGIRFENEEQCISFLTQLSEEVHRRMVQAKVLGKCLTLKLMVRAEDAPVETAKFMGHGYCNVINKSVSLSNYTQDLKVITKEVLMLCKKQKIDVKEMRGIGIQMTKLEMANKVSKGAMSKYVSVKSKFPGDVKESRPVDNNSQVINIKTEQNSQAKLVTTPKKEVLSPIKRSPTSNKSPKKKKKTIKSTVCYD